MSPRVPVPLEEGRGLISLFVRHPTAANLLMILMIVAGLVALTKLRRQFFPDFGIDVVVVSVAWPGATAEDVEANILAAIEPQVRFLDGVDRVVATAREGVGTVVLEYAQGADMQKAQAEVEQAVAQITTFPEDAREPRVWRVVRYDTIARLVLSGPFEEAVLERFAEEIRDRLLAAGIDRVTLFGVRDDRLLVELEPATLHALDLSLAGVAAAIAARSQEIPAGELSQASALSPRVAERARTAEELAELELATLPDGRRLRLADVAQVREAFDEDQPEGRRRGLRAVELHVQRALNADALEVQAILERELGRIRAELPPTLRLEVYNVMADLIRDRIRLLLENGATGFLLVLVILFLFLDARVAFWVAVGIAVSFGAMLAVLWLADRTINMVSLFAMILAIGIVVDDAIVVGEHGVVLRERGLRPRLAAEFAARRMLVPVTSATLTTIAAFLPLMVIGDIIGTIIREIPIVVTAVLLASLAECLLVLPAHLRHSFHRPRLFGGFRDGFDRLFARLREGPFRRLVVVAVRWRYTTLATALAALFLVFGLILGRHVPFVFFKGPESDRIRVSLVMVPGTPRAETEAALRTVERALDRAIRDLGGRPEEVVRMVFTRLGTRPRSEDGSLQVEGDQVGGLEVELAPSDQRRLRTGEIAAAWTRAVPPIAGLETLEIREVAGGPPGREVDIRLRGGASVAALDRAAEEVKAMLAALPGVSQIGDDLEPGKPEILVRLTNYGRSLGWRADEVGRQLRDALEGRVALRFPRGDEEVEVVVRLDRTALARLDLATFPLLAPDGSTVPLGMVARLEERPGVAIIRRVDGAREVAITAELDERTIRLDQVQEALTPKLEALAARAGVSWRFAGRAEERANTLADMRLGALLALGLIYVILAWVFGSFTRPLAVMAVIPFGLLGAVLGHLVMGYELTILSLIALLGLAGVLVNDSIILVSTVDELRAEGREPHEAIVEGTVSRLRAVVLTSLTTVVGLVPLLFETSYQAQFLIPMAITLVFGLAVNTVLVLLIVPALLAIQADFRRRPGPARPPAPTRPEPVAAGA